MNILDIAAVSVTQLAPRHRFPMPDDFVYRSERNQFGGGVTLLVKNNARRDQFVLTAVVNLESVAVYIFRIIHISCLFLVITHPTSQSCILTSIRSVLVADLNCKHTAWNCISVDRNGRRLLSYFLSQNIAINYPDHPTYFHTNFQISVLDIAL